MGVHFCGVLVPVVAWPDSVDPVVIFAALQPAVESVQPSAVQCRPLTPASIVRQDKQLYYKLHTKSTN